jgi:hypothetical protein
MGIGVRGRGTGVRSLSLGALLIESGGDRLITPETKRI